MSGWQIAVAVWLGLPVVLLVVMAVAAAVDGRRRRRAAQAARIRAQVRRIREANFYATFWTADDDRWLTDVGIKADR